MLKHILQNPIQTLSLSIGLRVEAGDNPCSTPSIEHLTPEMQHELWAPVWHQLPRDAMQAKYIMSKYPGSFCCRHHCCCRSKMHHLARLINENHYRIKAIVSLGQLHNKVHDWFPPEQRHLQRLEQAHRFGVRMLISLADSASFDKLQCCYLEIGNQNQFFTLW